jgi:uncharacterized protein
LKCLDDLLESLDYTAPVGDIIQGVMHTAVVTRECGLASTLPLDAFKQDERPLVREPGTLHGKKALELAQMARSERVMEAAIGMAAINSLIRYDASVCVQVNAAEVLGEKGRGGNVAIVGHFPFIPLLKERVKNLWVLEKNPQEGDLTEAAAESVLPQADVVGITGTSFTNHTLQSLLELCKPGAYILMLGDTTPMSPILFDFGIDALCGIKVVNREQVLSCVSQGANFRQIRGLRLLTMFKDKREYYNP